MSYENISKRMDQTTEMAMRDDLIAEVRALTQKQWGHIPKGTVVPSTESLTFGNTGIKIDATVLYADINGSTTMVDQLNALQAAEYYKAFLLCAGELVRAQDGVITAYDGDRIMAVYVGDTQSRNAVTTALKIQRALQDIINPEFDRLYGQHHRALAFTAGIDHGELLVAKTGVRGDNDLVWVGPAANYAAKLTSLTDLDPKYPIRVTHQVMERIGTNWLTRTADGSSIWEGPYNLTGRGQYYRTECWIDVT